MRSDTEGGDWFADGLRFACHRCGACCRGHPRQPSYVWLGHTEAERLAAFLELPPAAFYRRFVRLVGERYALIDAPDGACIFWSERDGCRVYPARPTQCRTFPFWPEHLRSPASWEAVCSRCPGAGRGRLYTLEELRALLAGRGDTNRGRQNDASR